MRPILVQALKSARVKGISLDQIAERDENQQRDFIAAIESEEFQLLPGGIFNRGFVRTYAESVGLDPDLDRCGIQTRLREVQELNEQRPQPSPSKGDGISTPLQSRSGPGHRRVLHRNQRIRPDGATPTTAPAPAEAPATSYRHPLPNL